MRELAAAGLSIRKIAALVFGDQRYRGRVERIIRGPETSEIGELLGPAAARKHERLLKLEQARETGETLKRLNDLTREID